MAPSIADDGHTVDEIDEALAWATRCDWRSGWSAFVDALLDERLRATKDGVMARDDLKRVILAEVGDEATAERLADAIIASASTRETRVVDAPERRGR